MYFDITETNDSLFRLTGQMKIPLTLNRLDNAKRAQNSMFSDYTATLRKDASLIKNNDDAAYNVAVLYMMSMYEFMVKFQPSYRNNSQVKISDVLLFGRNPMENMQAIIDNFVDTSTIYSTPIMCTNIGFMSILLPASGNDPTMTAINLIDIIRDNPDQAHSIIRNEYSEQLYDEYNTKYSKMFDYFSNNNNSSISMDYDIDIECMLHEMLKHDSIFNNISVFDIANSFNIKTNSKSDYNVILEEIKLKILNADIEVKRKVVDTYLSAISYKMPIVIPTPTHVGSSYSLSRAIGSLL